MQEFKYIIGTNDGRRFHTTYQPNTSTLGENACKYFAQYLATGNPVDGHWSTEPRKNKAISFPNGVSYIELS